MEYKRINENTIRCIITEEDMEDFGLDLDEFLSHSQKSDAFLRHIVEEAREELGYQAQHGMVSMRLEVLSDNRISLTFASGDDRSVLQQMLSNIQKVFPDVDKEILSSVMEQLAHMTEDQRKEKVDKLITDAVAKTIDNLASFAEQSKKESSGTDSQSQQEPEKDTYRLYVFDSMHDLIEYCHTIGLKQPIRSHLYKEKNQYYLIVERYRISEYNYNLLTAIAFEYAKVYAASEQKYDHLMEHGELILENKAIGILRKL